MRLLRLSVLFCLISLTSYSTTWFDIGLKGGYGVSQLYNKNIWKDKKVVNRLSTGYLIGGKLGVNFTPNFQVTLDFLYGSYKQDFEFNYTELKIPSKTKMVYWNSFDIPLLLRHNSDGGNYFEIGGYASFLSNENEDFDGKTRDLEDIFANNAFGATIGMGSFMIGSDNFYITIGARFNLGLSDIISNRGGKNSTSYFPVDNNEIVTEYSTYEKTVPVSFMFNLELNYDLGYIARSNCKRQAFVFF